MRTEIQQREKTTHEMDENRHTTERQRRPHTRWMRTEIPQREREDHTRDG
ncbi:hypothetical protein NP493_82g05039 [Ridgeia piscesae]|uniref:Uncharacterized protein n=1 Tax=Ridgeia piscesae TaxID=27915 RepID=A0AAD9P8Y8_RIDPI|nr:hypothetical protein NP493_82g05039 [Ridgeia piscesae]